MCGGGDGSDDLLGCRVSAAPPDTVPAVALDNLSWPGAWAPCEEARQLLNAVAGAPELLPEYALVGAPAAVVHPDSAATASSGVSAWASAFRSAKEADRLPVIEGPAEVSGTDSTVVLLTTLEGLRRQSSSECSLRVFDLRLRSLVIAIALPDGQGTDADMQGALLSAKRWAKSQLDILAQSLQQQHGGGSPPVHLKTCPLAGTLPDGVVGAHIQGPHGGPLPPVLLLVVAPWMQPRAVMQVVRAAVGTRPPTVDRVVELGKRVHLAFVIPRRLARMHGGEHLPLDGPSQTTLSAAEQVVAAACRYPLGEGATAAAMIDEAVSMAVMGLLAT